MYPHVHERFEELQKNFLHVTIRLCVPNKRGNLRRFIENLEKYLERFTQRFIEDMIIHNLKVAKISDLLARGKRTLILATTIPEIRNVAKRC